MRQIIDALEVPQFLIGSKPFHKHFLKLRKVVSKKKTPA